MEPGRQPVAVLRAHGFHPLSVKRVVRETRDASSFVLAVPEELGSTFSYLPGQFCTFRIEIEGGEFLRSYSMSSAPGVDPDLTVTVKRVPGGVVSNWFNDHVHEGSVLDVTRPAGVFCPRTTQAPVLALCGGSGVTPVVSIARSLLNDTARTVKLLYANRDHDSVIFGEALRDMGARNPDRLIVEHHYDSERGYLTTEAIERFAGGPVDADFYVCGPGPFMDLAIRTLENLGVRTDRILVERFEATELRSQTRNVDCEGEGPDSKIPRNVTLVLKGKTTTVSHRDGDTILETARRAGLQPPFSCEAGNCATCMALVKEGSATMRTNNALTAEELDEGWVLTCQAVPVGGGVTVEYESF